jgi:hypothetical protein
MPAQNAINNVQFTSVNIVTFDANGTYTPPANLLWAQVECVGGGGGSSGVPIPPSNRTAASAAGGSGGYTKKAYAKSSLSPNVTITIGSGGTGGAAGANDGNAGGATTFLSMSAGGGSPGPRGTTGFESRATGGSGGTASNGDINLTGYQGSQVLSYQDTLSQVVSLSPANTPSIYAPGADFPVNLLGINGSLYGGGASGVVRYNPGATGSAAGRNGAAGIVIITEFLAS